MNWYLRITYRTLSGRKKTKFIPLFSDEERDEGVLDGTMTVGRREEALKRAIIKIEEIVKKQSIISPLLVWGEPIL